MENFVNSLAKFVEMFASIVISLLEIMGIVVIIFGAFKAIFYFFKFSIKKERFNIKINLGNSLALGLEFKMGAEIIKTVVVRTLDELWILGAIILLRAILAVLIHWEIKSEKKATEEEHFNNSCDK